MNNCKISQLTPENEYIQSRMIKKFHKDNRRSMKIKMNHHFSIPRISFLKKRLKQAKSVKVEG
jgi:hypothetical protein